MANFTTTERAYFPVVRQSGTITGDGSSCTLSLGFVPKKFRLVNVTDVITWDKTSDMAAADSIKVVAAGTMTNDTGSHITFTGGGTTDGNGIGTVVCTATAIPNAKVCNWEAWG